MRTPAPFVSLFVLLGACVPLNPSHYDQDGDGHSSLEDDCDDSEGAVHPGAAQICDEFADNDCDGTTDSNEDDSDGDGQSECAGDCDDGDATAYLGAPNVCDGTLDNDCDGVDDPLETDDDGDGQNECAGDCDDGDATAYLGAPNVCDGTLDNDCDGVVDPLETDDDGDGQNECDNNGQGVDCDDDDSAAFVGAPDICDGTPDNDCDGVVDPLESDDDGDGVDECDPEPDCDDADDDRFPGNLERCDGVDNDCDGALGADETDDDGDGFTECDADGLGEDCDDSDDTVHPGAADQCDGVLDNDCDGSTDPLEDDGDGDGQSACNGDCDDADENNFSGNTEVCDDEDNDCDLALSEDEVDDDGDGVDECDVEPDCDDDDPANFPGNAETCDGLDNDCDGVAGADETDQDLDGFMPCGGDCDDSEAEAFPGNPETCDGLDNDCSGLPDFNVAAEDWIVSDSLDPGGPVYAPLSLVSQTLLPLEDDETSIAIPLGFDFSFSGLVYDELHVRSNGFVTFTGDDPGGEFTSRPLGVDDDLNQLIALWWIDLNPSVAGAVFYETLGSAPDRVFVVKFAGVPYWNQPATAGRVTAQLQLFETTNIIEMHYLQASRQPTNFDGLGISPTVGIEGVPPIAAVYLENDYNASLANHAVRFTPSTEQDEDSDGFLICDGDCDDGDAALNPGAAEVCDGLDNDCDGEGIVTTETPPPATQSLAGGQMLVGNLLQTTSGGVLTSFNVEAAVPTGDPISFLVYEADQPAGPFDLVDSAVGLSSASSTTWHESPSFSVELAAGRYYAVAMHVFGAVTVGWNDAASLPLPQSFGGTLGGLASPGLASAPTAWSPGPASDDVYAIELNLLYEVDADGDGAYACVDCDDADPARSPLLDEVWYDGLDADCDELSDFDQDGDGYDDPEDCDDVDASIRPYAWEDPTDGVDNDCDGLADGDDADLPEQYSLGEDDYDLVGWSGWTFPFCGEEWSDAWIHSNGFLTLDELPMFLSYLITLAEFEDYGVVAPLWTDLSPQLGGEIWSIDYGDAAGFYWLDVPENSAANSNSFSVVLEESGRIVFDFAGVEVLTGLTGWSCGSSGSSNDVDLTEEPPVGLDGGLGGGLESDLYEYFTSPVTHPFDLDASVLVLCGTRGVDSDGDGYTDQCGDPDDTDPLLLP